ncbi:MAG: hypothetical protein ACPLZF_02360 [Nitrososphaeria archaeon]
MPRYGWETEERIIVPSEIYTRDITDKIFELALKCLSNVVNFFLEFREMSSDLLTMVEQLKGVVEDASRKLG